MNNQIHIFFLSPDATDLTYQHNKNLPIGYIGLKCEVTLYYNGGCSGKLIGLGWDKIVQL